MKRVIEGSSFNTVVIYFNSSVCLFGLSSYIDPLFTTVKNTQKYSTTGGPPPFTTVSVVGCFNDGS